MTDSPDPTDPLRQRMNGNYEAPILREPTQDRPIPEWDGELSQEPVPPPPGGPDEAAG